MFILRSSQKWQPPLPTDLLRPSLVMLGVSNTTHDQLVSGIDWSARSNRIVTASHDRNSFPLPICATGAYSLHSHQFLLINLGGDTWARVSVWLAIGVLVYVFYGKTHSSLKDAIYVPANQVDEIYRTFKLYFTSASITCTGNASEAS